MAGGAVRHPTVSMTLCVVERYLKHAQRVFDQRVAHSAARQNG